MLVLDADDKCLQKTIFNKYAKLHASRAFMAYALHVPTFLTCLLALRAHKPYVPLVHLLRTCLHFLRALRAFIFNVLTWYMLIKLTEVNELNHDSSFLLLLSSVIYQGLSSTFISTKLVWFFLSLKRKILIN